MIICRNGTHHSLVFLCIDGSGAGKQMRKWIFFGELHQNSKKEIIDFKKLDRKHDIT
jgi:hypothetical protein